MVSNHTPKLGGAAMISFCEGPLVEKQLIHFLTQRTGQHRAAGDHRSHTCEAVSAPRLSEAV